MPLENKINLSIVIPVFNEEQYLNQLFLDLKKYFNRSDVEIIFVNDGSNDDSYQILEEAVKFKVKKIIVNAGGKLSLQKHEHRTEHWIIAEGEAEVVIGDKTPAAVKTKRPRVQNSGQQGDDRVSVFCWRFFKKALCRLASPP